MCGEGGFEQGQRSRGLSAPRAVGLAWELKVVLLWRDLELQNVIGVEAHVAWALRAQKHNQNVCLKHLQEGGLGLSQFQGS